MTCLTRLFRLLPALAVLALLSSSATGCGDDGGTPTDSSTGTDSASGDSGSGTDSAPADSGSTTDGATDAGGDSSIDAAADASSDAASDASADTSTDAAPDATADGGAACAQDEDCRAFSSYCDGCTCLALGADEPDPVCGGTTVTCFVDPCSVVGPVRCNASGACVIGPSP